jgi:hypothetical protein
MSTCCLWGRTEGCGGEEKRKREREGDEGRGAYVAEELNSRLNQTSKEQCNQDKRSQHNPRRLQFLLRQQYDH